MRIKFWGCRGSIPIPDSRMIEYGGNTTCVEVDLDGRILIIDAGTGIRRLGEDLLKRNIYEIDLFITHSHWDHIQGFPFFKLIYEKKAKINIFGCTNSYSKIRDILAGQMSYEYFPVRFSELNAEINFVEFCGNSYELGNYKITTIQTNHPIYTIGIKIENSKKSFIFITDNELALKEPNTPWEDFVTFCQNTDCLVHDAQFTETEYLERYKWGHSSYEQVVELAKAASVKKLGLFHHDPDRQDKDLEILQNNIREKCLSENCGFSVFAVKEQNEIIIK